MSTPFLHAISTLTAWEMRHFHDFAYSPYHNKHQGVRAMVDILMESHPQVEELFENKQALWQKIFPDRPFAAQKLYDLQSRAAKLFDRFLAQESIRAKEAEETLQLMDNWRNRMNQQAFSKAQKRLDKMLPKLPAAEALRCQFRAAENQAMLNANHKNRNPDESLQAADHFLDAYYLHQKLRLACELLNRRQMGYSDYQGHLIQEVLHHLDHFPEQYAPYPALQSYKMLFHLLEGGKGFEKLRLYLLEHAAALHAPELRSIYEYLLNFSIRQLNQGGSEFRGITYELYLQMLDRELLVTDGIFSESHYKNIVTLASRLGHFEWVEGFIDTYSPLLAEHLREPVKTYNLAALAYERGDFGRAKRLLQAFRVKDVYYDMGARSILLKIYFELEETEALLSLMEAFRDYLRRKKGVSGYQKELYRNLLRFTRTMVRLRERRGLVAPSRYAPAYEKFMAEVEATPKVGQRPWLLETAASLAP